ncbi:hypothetical protein IHE78_04725 [Serratia marcescens]|nr:hypothetical protein [Serratia marcescens]HEB0100866.1 hypothetical protein [Serratia marcescens]
MVDDSENMIVTQAEISALKKLIMYVKFSCDDVESLEYAGSYEINSFFDKLIAIDYLEEFERKFYDIQNPDNEIAVMSKINKYQHDSLNKMSDKTMREVFKQCLHPFKPR